MFQNILIPIDLDQESSWHKALPQAVQLCKTSNAPLHVFTVVPDFGMAIVSQYFPANYEKEFAEKTLETLRAFVAEHVPSDIKSRCIVGDGSIYEAILKAAANSNADLIIVASHRPELKDYLLGPNAARVVRHAKCSVMVVR